MRSRRNYGRDGCGILLDPGGPGRSLRGWRSGGTVPAMHGSVRRPLAGRFR